MNAPSSAPGPAAERRHRAVMRVLVLVLATNLTAAGVKLGYGFWAHQLAFTADGVHALLDGTSNVLAIVGARIASAPPDEEHPYGHQRFEAIAALAIGALIVLGLYEILDRAFSTLVQGTPAAGAGWSGVGLAAVTFVVGATVARHESTRAKELKSGLLSADAGHTTSDAIAAGVLLAGSVASHYGVARADAAAAIVLAGFVAKTAWDVLRDNVGVLSDARRVDPDRVRLVALKVAGVRGAHKVRSRGSADHVLVDLHIHVDPAMTVEQAHSLTHRVADKIREEVEGVEDVIIHTEPADGREAKT